MLGHSVDAGFVTRGCSFFREIRMRLGTGGPRDAVNGRGIVEEFLCTARFTQQNMKSWPVPVSQF